MNLTDIFLNSLNVMLKGICKRIIPKGGGRTEGRNSI